jgi:predicted nicotinamide N-methyase
MPPPFALSGAIGPSSTGSLPLLPDGRCVRIREGNVGLGGRLWPSAGALCRWQRSLADEFAGSHVLELGCGSGAVDIYAAALGASRVVLTDGGAPDLLSLAAHNVETNSHLWAERGSEVCVQRLRWGEVRDVQPAWTVPPGSRGWILGSDVTYARAAHRDLCVELGSLLKHNPGCQAVLAHQQRAAGLRGVRALRGVRGLPMSSRPRRDRQLEHLVRTAAALGLSIREWENSGRQPGVGAPRMRELSHDISLLEVTVR